MEKTDIQTEFEVNFMKSKQIAVKKACCNLRPISKWCIVHNYFWWEDCISEHSDCNCIDLEPCEYLPGFLISIVMIYAGKLEFLNSEVSIDTYEVTVSAFKHEMLNISKYKLVDFMNSQLHSEEIKDNISLSYKSFTDNYDLIKLARSFNASKNQEIKNIFNQKLNELKLNVKFVLIY